MFRKHYHIIWLIVIVLIGLILRLLVFDGVSLMNDELSTLRHMVPNFIQSVKTEGHPIGFFLFTKFWSKLFGDSAIALKVPSVIAGVISIYLTYKIGVLWFKQKQVALLAAAFIATTQYTILYSQIARMYALGLMFALLTILCWTYFVINQKRPSTIVCIGFVLSSLACMYLHYFAGLLVGIVWVTGLVTVKRNNMIAYTACVALCCLCYLPHLETTLNQMKQGGLTWLGKPNPTFLFQYLCYLFHFSLLPLVVTVAIVAIGLCRTKIGSSSKNKFRLIALLWFTLPIAIGYIYSVVKMPVLQYSVIIFGFPLFILLLFSFSKKIEPKLLSILLILLIGANVFTLIYGRKHYEIVNAQPYKAIVEVGEKYSEQVLNDNFWFFSTNPRRYVNYYYERQNADFHYFTDLGIDMSEKDFIEEMSYGTKEVVAIASKHLSRYAIMNDYYPYFLEKVNLSGTEIVVLSKNKPKDGKGFYYNSIDVSGGKVLNYNSSQEWGVSFIQQLEDIAKSRFDIIDVRVDVANKDSLPKNALLVFYIKNGDKTIFWRAANFKNYYQEDGSYRVYLSERLNNYIKFNSLFNKCTLETFVWNKELEEVTITDFSIKVRDGNPYVYGLFEAVN